MSLFFSKHDNFDLIICYSFFTERCVGYALLAIYVLLGTRRSNHHKKVSRGTNIEKYGNTLLYRLERTGIRLPAIMDCLGNPLPQVLHIVHDGSITQL